MTQTIEVVIDVRDGYKKYLGSDYILKGLNMAVPRGSIYSLLGPSGCGKTTLLSCIVGLHELSSGFINMPSIKSPLDFSFMPQEVALELSLTIEETFHIYGLMFGIEAEIVYNRLESLTSLLHLPSKGSIISTLSGGQQRRVSFAVALINDARTLLMDEPTVGLDPLLTSEIWEHLHEITRNENKTIILTTHYIDEARRSDKVGFMRDGIILKEGEPKALMDQYSCRNLEDVFIFLCRANTTDNQITSSPVEEQTKRINKQDAKSTYNYKTELFNVDRFKAHVYKDFLWTKRNLVLFLALISLPVYTALLVSWIYGYYPNDLKIGLVTEEIAFANPENICSPHKYVRYGDSFQDFNNCSLYQSLSCQYYQQLKKKFDVVLYDNVESAVRDARVNKIWGVLELSSNFTEALMARVNDGKEVADVDIVEAQVGSQLDMSNFVLGYHILDNVRQAILKILVIAANSCGNHGRVAKLPLQIVEEFYQGSGKGSGSEAPGFMVGFSLYLSIMYTSSALIYKAGALQNRNQTIGVTFLEVVAGHLVIQFLMLLIQNGSMLFIFYVIFDNTFNGSLILAIVGLFLVDSVGIAIGVFFSKVLSSPVTVAAGTIFYSLSAVVMGGFMWPEEGMHWILQYVKWLFPTQPVITSLINIIIKDFGMLHPSVYIGYLNCVFWVFIYASLTYVCSEFNFINLQKY